MGEIVEIPLSELGAYGAMVGEQRIEQLCAEVARLRAFVRGLVSDCELGQHIGSNIGVIWLKERCEAALTPADDWPAQHDAGVRQEFLRSLREPDILMTWVEYEINPLKGWHAVCRNYKGTDEIAVKYFGEADDE